jgi:hypothetical protein
MILSLVIINIVMINIENNPGGNNGVFISFK